MKTMRELLDSLPAKDYHDLMYAFEQQLQYHVKLPDDPKRFIGVNCKDTSILKIETEAGFWSTGTIIGEYR